MGIFPGLEWKAWAPRGLSTHCIAVLHLHYHFLGRQFSVTFRDCQRPETQIRFSSLLTFKRQTQYAIVHDWGCPQLNIPNSHFFGHSILYEHPLCQPTSPNYISIYIYAAYGQLAGLQCKLKMAMSGASSFIILGSPCPRCPRTAGPGFVAVLERGEFDVAP